MGSVPMTVTEPPIQEGLSSPPVTGTPADTAPALHLNNTSPDCTAAAASRSNRRQSKGQKHQRRAPLEPREKTKDGGSAPTQQCAAPSAGTEVTSRHPPPPSRSQSTSPSTSPSWLPTPSPPNLMNSWPGNCTETCSVRGGLVKPQLSLRAGH